MVAKSNKMAESTVVDEVDTNLLFEAPVVPIDATFGIVKVNSSKTLTVQKMIQKEFKRGQSDVTIVFAVRHVGCPSCREHGSQMVELAKSVGGISVAVVKETGVNDEALLTFHQEFFKRGPLYKDEHWKIYKSMGGRRLSVLTILSRLIPFKLRMETKRIKSEQVGRGDFWTQGGMLVFDKNGQLIHAAHDEFGIEFDIVTAEQAIEKHRATLKP